MENSRLAGYRIMEFSEPRKHALKQIAERLIPHKQEVLDSWIDLQWQTWEPPGLTREELKQVFGKLFFGTLECMRAGELEVGITNLADAGAELAERQFPFEALIISIHFLEKSYLPFLVAQSPENAQEQLIAMDEFLHAALATLATSYFEAHRKDLLERAEVGRLVQEGLLADIPKHIADLDVAHIYVSAREQAKLGGDFLDTFALSTREVVFIIGDLSGHGLEAAADSVMLRSLFKGFMREDPDLARAMARLNRVLMVDLRRDQFATALAAMYDALGRLRLVNAGHPRPVMCDSVCRQLQVPGSALAIEADSTYAAEEIDFDEGAVFVAYTDGLVEVRNNGEFFGEQGVMEAVVSVHTTSARGIAEHVVDRSLHHAGGKFADDVAVLVLKRRASG